jgi:hypothetical protein
MFLSYSTQWIDNVNSVGDNHSVLRFMLDVIGKELTQQCRSFLFGALAGVSENCEFDIFGDAVEVNSIPVRELNFLKAMIVQLDDYRDLNGDNPLPLALRSHLARIFEPGEDVRPLIEVLRKYRNEWLSVIEDGQRCGRRWAGWYGPIQSALLDRSVA